jgi:hypothetical protein
VAFFKSNDARRLRLRHPEIGAAARVVRKGDVKPGKRGKGSGKAAGKLKHHGGDDGDITLTQLFNPTGRRPVKRDLKASGGNTKNLPWTHASRSETDVHPRPVIKTGTKRSLKRMPPRDICQNAANEGGIEAEKENMGGIKYSESSSAELSPAQVTVHGNGFGLCSARLVSTVPRAEVVQCSSVGVLPPAVSIALPSAALIATATATVGASPCVPPVHRPPRKRPSPIQLAASSRPSSPSPMLAVCSHSDSDDDFEETRTAVSKRSTSLSVAKKSRVSSLSETEFDFS